MQMRETLRAAAKVLRRIADTLERDVDACSENAAVDAPEALISIKSAAEMLGVSMIMLRRWDKSGRLKSVRPSGSERGHRRYKLSSIQELVLKMKDAATPERGEIEFETEIENG